MTALTPGLLTANHASETTTKVSRASSEVSLTKMHDPASLGTLVSVRNLNSAGILLAISFSAQSASA